MIQPVKERFEKRILISLITASTVLLFFKRQRPAEVYFNTKIIKIQYKDYEK